MKLKKIIIFTLLITLMLTLNLSISIAESEFLEVHYFYSELCSSCNEVNPMIDKVGKMENVKLIKHDIAKENVQSMQLLFAESYGVGKLDIYTIPSIYVGDESFIGKTNIKANLKNTVHEYLVSERYPIHNVDIITLDGLSDESLYEEEFEKINIFSVILAGFIDGVNPCAISVLMIFCSFLLYGVKKDKIVPIISFFIIGSFTMNFIVGVFLFKFVEFLSGKSAMILSVFYILSILLSSIALVINSRDIYNTLKKNHDNHTNQLPDSTKSKIFGLIRKFVDSSLKYPLAFVLGLAVSMLEFGCTGQIYVPTLAYMLNQSSSINVLILIMLYNLAFITPLILVFIASIKVKSPDKVKEFVFDNLIWIKIMANLFFVIIIFVLFKKL